jgi:hypothetical protein
LLGVWTSVTQTNRQPRQALPSRFGALHLRTVQDCVSSGGHRGCYAVDHICDKGLPAAMLMPGWSSQQWCRPSGSLSTIPKGIN